MACNAAASRTVFFMGDGEGDLSSDRSLYSFHFLLPLGEDSMAWKGDLGGHWAVFLCGESFECGDSRTTTILAALRVVDVVTLRYEWHCVCGEQQSHRADMDVACALWMKRGECGVAQSLTRAWGDASSSN